MVRRPCQEENTTLIPAGGARRGSGGVSSRGFDHGKDAPGRENRNPLTR